MSSVLSNISEDVDRLILSVRGLSFQYKGKSVFKNIDLDINEPGIYGLIAPNGFGKTTFLNVISGLLPYQQGTIELLGERLSRKVAFHSICFTQDSSMLYDYLSAYDHLKFYCEQYKIGQEKIEDVTRFLNMASYYKKPVRTYSMGMKQRSLLAIALLSESDILLLDEPLNGLDPTSTILIREAILKIAEAGRTVIVSSHNLDEIDKITNNILFINDQNIWLENMQAYHQTFVELELEAEEYQRASDLFERIGLETSHLHNSLIINSPSVSGAEIINSLIDHQIYIKNFNKRISGSEQRYKALYEVKNL